MQPREVIEELSAIERRAAGSDAERRAARVLARRLRRSGRRGTRAETVWVRPHWPAVHALICVAAVAGSTVSVSDADVGLALSAGALLAFVADLAGVRPLRSLTFERATQNVVSPDPSGERRPVRLVLTAAVDAPRPERLAIAHRLALGAMAALAACCAVRVGVDDPSRVIGIVQLAPTVVLLAVVGVFLDAATTPVARNGAGADASAAAAVLAILAALDRRPPRKLAVEAVLAGAGHAHALGMRDWARRQRRAGLRAEEVCVLHVAACGAGTPVWWTHEGLVLPLRYSRQLLGLAETVAHARPELAARPARRAGTSGAHVARARRWPALAVGALDADGLATRSGTDEDTPGAVDDRAVEATVAFVLALVAALDRDLLERGVANPPPGGGSSRP